LRAAIFDLDGLLVHSEPLWREAERRIFSALGLVLSEEDLAQTTGIRLDEVVRIRYREQPWSGPGLAEVAESILEELESLVRARGQAMPGAEQAVHFFVERNIPLGLASSSPLRIIKAQLEHISLLEAFDCIHSAEREVLGKPYPGVYLRTAESLQVPARECLAFEDSLPGLIAAKAASMKAVAVPEPHFATHPGMGIADRQLRSLEEWDAALWAAFGGKGTLPRSSGTGTPRSTSRR
jgi:beta-phosphoglucomutase-like phosphatase (HAD superfamily)